MSEFLSKQDSNKYFEKRNILHADAMANCKHRFLEKVFPGKRLVVYERLATGKFEIKYLFAVNVIGMDRDGVYIVLRDLVDDQTLKVGHVPVTVTSGGKAVYASVPSHTNMERTCRMEGGVVKESMACLMMVKMSNSVMSGNVGDMYMSDIKFFMERAGEAEGAKLINAFQFKGNKN